LVPCWLLWSCPFSHTSWRECSPFSTNYLIIVWLKLTRLNDSVISTDIDQIRQATTIIFLCLGTLAIPLFVFWMHRQVKIGEPALIPNYLWRNVAFPCICVITAMSFAVINSLELFVSLLYVNTTTALPQHLHFC
jgi:hypothetical protein